MKKLAILFSAFFLCCAFCSCSSGGSSGGSSSGSASTGIRVLHASIDAAPVDLISSTDLTKVLQTARFSLANFYQGLNTGPQIISLFRSLSSSSPLFTSELDVQSRDRYSLILYGNTDNLGLRMNLIKDERPQIEQGMSALRVVHGAIGAAQINSLFGSTSVASALDFGSASSYVLVPAGTAIFSSSRTVDAKSVVSEAKVFESGRAYTVLVAGEVDYLVVARVFED